MIFSPRYHLAILELACIVDRVTAARRIVVLKCKFAGRAHRYISDRLGSLPQVYHHLRLSPISEDCQPSSSSFSVRHHRQNGIRRRRDLVAESPGKRIMV
jgi:hypothetical protein